MKQLLHKMFNHYNQTLFSGALKSPDIEIDLTRKFAMRLIDNTIWVGVEIPAATAFDLHSMLIHEMVHVHNAELGLEDVGINQYHNRNFSNKCVDLGFYVIRHGTQGWSLNTVIPVRNITNKGMVKEPDPANRNLLLQAIESCQIDRNEFSAAIASVNSLIAGMKPAKTFFLKYVCRCPEPHNSIRSGRRPDGRNALDITCNRCNCSFTCVSD